MSYHMLKTISMFTYERNGRNTWEQTLTHDWNTCTKSTRLQGLNTYYTLWTLQGWSYCRVLPQKWWETSKSNILPKMQNTTLILSVTQPSAAVQVQQIPMVTKRLSLTDLYKIYWLQGLNHYYTLQSNERLKCHGVTVTTSDMNTVQKIQDKIFNENLMLQWQTEKMAKFYKMAKCVFSWPAQLKNGQFFRNWPCNGQSGNPGPEASWIQGCRRECKRSKCQYDVTDLYCKLFWNLYCRYRLSVVWFYSNDTFRQHVRQS